MYQAAGQVVVVVVISIHSLARPRSRSGRFASATKMAARSHAHNVNSTLLPEIDCRA
jgi:hypothetical protein